MNLTTSMLLSNRTALKLLNNASSLLEMASNEHPVLLNTRTEVIDHLLADQIGTFETPVQEQSDISILKLVHDYLLVFLLASVMFSMGCGITIHEVRLLLFFGFSVFFMILDSRSGIIFVGRRQCRSVFWRNSSWYH